jgi:hypothetical protein
VLYRVAFRKKVYGSIDELQADLDLWIREYNEQRPRRQAPRKTAFGGRQSGEVAMSIRWRHETYDLCFARNRVVDF